MMRVAAVAVLGTVVLAGLAGGVAEYLRVHVDEASPVKMTAAALLVLVPGVTGELVAVGFASGLRGAPRAPAPRWNVGIAATLGALAALAVATCLVHAFALFPFLDSKLWGTPWQRVSPRHPNVGPSRPSSIPGSCARCFRVSGPPVSPRPRHPPAPSGAGSSS